MNRLIPFGDYELAERVSVGGMAEVFRARRRRDGAMVAIKRILPSMAEDPEYVTMFQDEASIASRLEHPGIARVFDGGVHEGWRFIAMEFVSGRDLLQIQNRVRRARHRLPFPMIAFVAARMAEALDHAHRRVGPDGEPLGIIHRDVSPQNVIVAFDGDIKLVDFGIAKAATRATRTLAGVLKGKFGYMSPELVEGREIDRRADVFSIGTILHELITLERLFLCESDFATLEKVRTVDVPPPREVAPDCPPALERIVLRALERDPERRYPWASALRDDLEEFLAGEPAPFGRRELVTWLGEHFAQEIQREQRIIAELAAEPRSAEAAPAPLVSLATVPAPEEPTTPAAESVAEHAPAPAAPALREPIPSGPRAAQATTAASPDPPGMAVDAGGLDTIDEPAPPTPMPRLEPSPSRSTTAVDLVAGAVLGALAAAGVALAMSSCPEAAPPVSPEPDVRPAIVLPAAAPALR